MRRQLISAMVMLWLAWPAALRAADAASSTFYPRTLQSEAGTPVVLTPDQEPVSLTARRQWQLHFPNHPDTRVDTVRLALPRAGLKQQLSAARWETGWHLGTLEMDRVGVWVLDVRFDAGNGPDRVRFKLAVDEQPFVVAREPSAAQVALIKAMALPLDPNRETDDTTMAQARLGHALFFDPRISRSGTMACASCHVPDRAFSDGKPRSRDGSRNAPSLIGVAQKRWFNRDGSKDSLWSQALGPLEHPAELGLDRITLLQRIAANAQYRESYERAFAVPLARSAVDPLPAASPLGDAAQQQQWEGLTPAQHTAVNRHFANIGRALAAYQSQLIDQPSAFDRYAHNLGSNEDDTTQPLGDDAQRGLLLFIGSRTQCLDCHSGPTFSNAQFHNIGTAPTHNPLADRGRTQGIAALLDDPFNCRGAFSDTADSCEHLDRVWNVEIPYLLEGAFLTPGLRNVALTGPWFHDGSADSLEAVMAHYRQPPASKSGRTEHELSGLVLSDQEIGQIIAFLESLTGDSADSPWFSPPTTQP